MNKTSNVITKWTIENRAFWETHGRQVARRNLWLSIPALFLAFAVWMIWSVVVVKLPQAGFTFSTEQLFWLAAVPSLSGATLRIFYSFMVPIFGGRRWTAISTATLLIPTIGMGFAIQDLETPYSVFLGLALLCGFGGGNFASSMANISYFYPKNEKGHALALNAGLGNLGVSAVQFIVPLVIMFSILGEPQTTAAGTYLWLQNAGFFWVPLIVLSTLAAWFWMDDLADCKASFSSQLSIFKCKHNWIMCFLYVGTFGSFIGFSAGFPLLAKSQFPEVNALQLAFIGPLAGALARAGSGWLSDKYGGGRVTFWVFFVLMLGALGVHYFLGHRGDAYAFYGFFAMFILLFIATGVGNASTFQMIPTIFVTACRRAMHGATDDEVRKVANREAAATIGFTSAIGAYGGFFIPKSYGTSIAITGTPDAALLVFTGFYVCCLLLTWWYYTRRSAETPC